MRHANERPARHIHGGEKALARDVDDAPLQRVFRGKRDRVHGKVEPAPVLADALENRLHLAPFAHVERHHDRRLELASERLDVFLCLVVEIGDRELGSQRAERLGAAPSDRIFIGNADDEAFFALEQLGFYDRDHRLNPLCGEFERDSGIVVAVTSQFLAHDLADDAPRHTLDAQPSAALFRRQGAHRQASTLASDPGATCGSVSPIYSIIHAMHGLAVSPCTTARIGSSHVLAIGRPLDADCVIVCMTF